MAPTSSTSDPIIESTPSTLSAGNNVIDATHLYYIHPSDYPRMILVSVVFDRKNYGGWRRVVIIVLSAKNKPGFIDDSLAIPIADLTFQKARSCFNDMVISWLLHSLFKEIAESVLYSQSAKELWIDLEDRFGETNGETNGEKLFQLQKERNVVVQCSISDYFTKMKSLWDELDVLNTFGCLCLCVRLWLIPWLSKMKSNEKSIILMPIQRALHLLYPSFKPPKGSVESKMNSSTCAYCKKPGHSIDKCYMIHGFSLDFKFTKERRFQTMADNAYHTVEEVDQGGNGFSNGKTLTQENIGEFLQLLQQLKLG
ncbi:uncharacterized protein LOC125855870 [Solanum stenotomum]|uniref:uncharacterized protein LOC125855870 n=1 Tax=Solanum stenotomum TaxID=172797 RepID=UPI0020D0111C|nr:uncharacterized protein LOC125855870 [Solanum stenotomum]